MGGGGWEVEEEEDNTSTYQQQHVLDDVRDLENYFADKVRWIITQRTHACNCLFFFILLGVESVGTM